MVDAGAAVVLYAGRFSLERRLPMADASIYATALLNEATVYTQDAHFEGLAQVRCFAKPAKPAKGRQRRTGPRCGS